MRSGAMLKIQNLDDVWESNTVRSIDINDIPYTTVKDRELFDKTIITVYGDDYDQLDVPASCNCVDETTRLTGIQYRGNICPHCKTKVDYDHLKGYEHNMWIRTPEGVPSLIHPFVFAIMYEKLVPSGAKHWNGFMWLIRSTYREPPATNQKAYDFCLELKAQGFKRGLEYFEEQYDKIVEFLLSKTTNLKDFDAYSKLLRSAKPDAFPHRLPVPTKSSLVLKNTSLGNFSEKSLAYAKDAIVAVATLDEDKPSSVKGNRMAHVMESLYLYLEETTKESYNKKGQVARGLLYGTVTEYTLRAVLSSETGPHQYDETKVPYSELVVLLEVHLVSLLVKRYGWGFKRALNYINNHKANIDPFVEELLTTLFKESPTGRGFHCLMTRYPSLDKGSTRLFLITGWTKGTITLSILAVKAPNADFDGDNMTLTLLLSKEDVEAAIYFHPSRGIHDLSSPGEVDHDMQLPDPTVVNIYSFFEEEDMLIEQGAI